MSKIIFFGYLVSLGLLVIGSVGLLLDKYGFSNKIVVFVFYALCVTFLVELFFKRE